MAVPAQDGITRDNVTVRVDAVVYFRVVDPIKATVNVQNYLFAISQQAQTSLRSIIDQSEMDQLLAERDSVNRELRRIIDEPTERPWGIRVERVEIKDVSLPEGMKRSMSRQAERERRARIITADGEYQASRRLRSVRDFARKEWPLRAVRLTGHEYVAAAARAAGIGFVKEGNCFTDIADPQGLAQVADALSQHAAVGRLGQVCDRWIYTACLCFGLDLADQARTGFRYSYSIYQAEYSRNLLFRSGAQMQDLLDRICDRTRSRLDIPALRTLFGLKHRPHSSRAAGPPAQEIVIENSQYGLTWFRIRFGLLQCKAYTKGEHVLRFEATVHNARELRCRRGLDNFPEIITRLAGMAERLATTLDGADVSFLADGTLDELPLPSRLGATRVGGIDLNKPRIRAALAAALALAAAPHGFTVAEHAAKVSTMTGQSGYTIRQAAYDLPAPRGAPSYPRHSREELGRRFLGLMAYSRSER
jgi:SPFH domain / Band 7 family